MTTMLKVTDALDAMTKRRCATKKKAKEDVHARILAKRQARPAHALAVEPARAVCALADLPPKADEMSDSASDIAIMF